MTETLLIVEDDKNLRETLADNLELEGFDVVTASSIAQGKQVLQNEKVDLVILDIMLPDGEGFSLCEWAQQHVDVLVLMLSARTLEKDIVQGFISGCDDYLSKPYRSAELVLRIRALLRRKGKSTYAPNSASTSTDINGFLVNWELREVTKQGDSLHLTKTAFDLLEYMYQHQNNRCSRDDILDNVWGKDVYVDNRTVDNFVSNLKKQLQLSDPQPYRIKTIRGVGYSLVTQNPVMLAEASTSHST